MQTAIRADSLTRKFGKFTAVDGVSFEIPYGSIFGFLGSNGAGKSTTIRMLCGILQPTAGSAWVAGFDVTRDPEKIKESIGYVSQRFSLYGDLSVEENLRFYGSIYLLTGERLEKRIREVYELTGLGPWKDRLAGHLSGGWKQRLAIANGFLHDPKILFLDEPTAGIDPLSRRDLWEVLYELAARGVALFVTTHYMEEAERCAQIAFISRGKILKIGAPAQLKAQIPGKVLEVQCEPLLKASKIFRGLPGLINMTVYGTALHLNVESPETAMPALMEAARENALRINAVKPVGAGLEDVFAALAREENRETD
ncbi:MAG: ABC transporter ATP-binding protein [Candidatus Omnitrophica bacterium]|nr:ABC transporter ATP-binding protein [Candidatus Omnitrophota bacterium]